MMEVHRQNQMNLVITSICILLMMILCISHEDSSQIIPYHMRLNRHNLGTHDYDCEEYFRLSRDQLITLADALLPGTFYSDSNDRINNVHGLCLVLRRLSFPCRGKDMRRLFGYSTGTLSRHFHTTLRVILETWEHLLSFDPGH